MKIIKLNIYLILILIVFMLSVSVKAEESSWKLYYTSPVGTEHYYDSKSIIRTSQGQSKTTKRFSKARKRYKKALSVKVTEKILFVNQDHKLTELEILREFNCSKGVLRILKKSEFYRNGLNKIEEKVYPWQHISNEQYNKALYDIVCKS